jgi:predicted nucleic acid-binding protein
MYLLDASALLPLVTRRGKQLLTDAASVGLMTTNLALYEACNGLWKIAALLKTISLADAVSVAAVLEELASENVIQTVGFGKLDFSKTLELACKEKLTFYDASYIVMAENYKATLVTADGKLKKVAGKCVKTENYINFEKILTET